MRFIEETEAAWSAEQLAAAEAEIEQQKREWEEERLAALRLQEEEDERNAVEASEELLTFSREDAQNQVNNSTKTGSSIKSTPTTSGHLPRTRSRATVHIDLWTLDVSPIASGQSQPPKKDKINKTPPQPAGEVKKEKKLLQNSTSSITVPASQSCPKKVVQNSTSSVPVPAPNSNPKKLIHNSTPSVPVPAPYSNPNLVIRTRRASSNPVLSKGTWDLNNHVSDPCLVGRKLAKLNRAKRRSASCEGNGPVL